MILCAYFGSGAQALAATPPTFSEIISHCESCHGIGGNSTTPSVPRLNGLSGDYLFLRLQEFRNPTSQSIHATDNMWPVVTSLSDDTKRKIADHFAQQPPTRVTLAGPALGKRLYEQGLPAQNVPACSSCHGLQAEGSASGPRLAGQHLEYLKTQLWSFNLVSRVHGTMNAGAMKFMSEDIDALATYLAGR